VRVYGLAHCASRRVSQPEPVPQAAPVQAQEPVAEQLVQKEAEGKQLVADYVITEAEELSIQLTAKLRNMWGFLFYLDSVGFEAELKNSRHDWNMPFCHQTWLNMDAAAVKHFSCLKNLDFSRSVFFLQNFFFLGNALTWTNTKRTKLSSANIKLYINGFESFSNHTSLVDHEFQTYVFLLLTEAEHRI
jgi:hypothetical protein